jgi:hypothetical protein
MVDWQVTAITINCRAIAEEATITVKNDWSVKCSGCDKLATSRRAQLLLVERSMILKRSLECHGLQCDRIREYLEKLQAAERAKPMLDGEQK